MSTLLNFYKVLDEDLFQKIGYTEQPLKAFYENDNEEIVEMEIALEEGIGNTFKLIDPKVHWDPELHDVELHFDFEIENPSFLFGENGLTENDGILGVALRWYSRDISELRIEPLELIKFSDVHIQQKKTLKIEKGILRGRVTLEVILYVYQPSVNQPTVSGTILGTLSFMNLLIDGSASMFPILELDDPTKPLWWIECNFEDALYDSFTDDNVAIIFNVGHKHAKHLIIEKGVGSSPLLVEILATGIQTIIEEVKNSGDWEDVLSNKGESGSIAEAIYYFISTFSWDTSSPKDLLKSIREDFNKRF